MINMIQRRDIICVIMAPGLLVKHKVSQLTVYPELRFLDTHPLVPYIRVTRDKKIKLSADYAYCADKKRLKGNNGIKCNLRESAKSAYKKEDNMRRSRFIIAAVAVLFLIGCQAPKIRLFPSAADPLQEYTLAGSEKGKVLVVSIRGTISDAPKKQFISTHPSMVQEVVSQLRKAEKDSEVRAVILKVNSPGGSVTASDILYNEIVAYKQKTKAKVVVAMMGVAASGGYYISLPADYIFAHPTSVTGSVGVLFLRPDVAGLMDKIGLGVEVSKTGKNKDMGSPFRQATAEEKQIIKDLIDQLGKRFMDRIAEHRKIDPDNLKAISTARIFLADDALKLGMVDGIGYLADAVSRAKKLADLPQDAKIVVYRRTEYPDDNLYNTSTTHYEGRGLSIVSLDLPASLTSFQAGFYYLWQPGVMDE
jgi:protease-4